MYLCICIHTHVCIYIYMRGSGTSARGRRVGSHACEGERDVSAKKHTKSSREEDTGEGKLSEHQLGGWRAVSALGLKGRQQIA